ncbi:sensor histidine kinase [Lentzea sp. NBRC 105346]|uniref:sensor histidine kinase n=1 Tax=Lentzea sp. NBRC 105346 TaxID=3032205 RepID=UPI0025546F5C|nr:sensor histidine kinase [Lentzea sp. NBRC 105346]
MTTVNVWDRTRSGWHVAFAVFALVCVVLVIAEGRVTAGSRALALALLAALCALYFTVGARALNREPRGRIYVAIAIPVTIAMFALVPAMSVMFFALYPQIWSLLPTRQAVAGTAVTSLGIGAVILVTGGFSEDAVGVASIILIGLFSAILLGLWITRIIEQSHERARLVAELDATRTELAQVSHDAGVLAERERLARDLHDTIAQGSASVLLLLQAARKSLPDNEHLVLAEETTRENLREIRSLVAALAPVELDGAALPAALERLTARLGRELAIDTEMTTTGEYRRLAPDREVTLLRVTQEALANVRKHAQATAVRVRLAYQDTGTTLTVTDDGRGFSPDAERGYGLDGLRDRVRLAGGEFDVRTKPGEGVAIEVRMDA